MLRVVDPKVPGKINTFDNPLSFYPAANALICTDCRHELADDIVGAAQEARVTSAEERHYQAGYAYACGYLD